MPTVSRIQRYIVGNSKPSYYWFKKLCHFAGDLKNFDTYGINKIHIQAMKHGYFIPYNMKEQAKWEHYLRKMTISGATNLVEELGTQLCQSIDREVMQNYKTYLKTLKDWKRYPSKYSEKPHMPHCHKPGIPCSFVMSNIQFKFHRNSQTIDFGKRPTLWWKKRMSDFCLKLDPHYQVKKVQQLQVIPCYDFVEIIVNVKVKVPELCKDNARYFGIDLGEDNLAVVGSNVPGIKPLKISNGYLKWKGHNAYKHKAKIQSKLKKNNHKDWSHRLEKLRMNCKRVTYNYLHEACQKIIDYAVENNISRVVIGTGAGNAQKSANLGKRTNQIYCHIPFAQFIQCLQYKAQDTGIQVLPTEESYTSQSSFLDCEKPCKYNGNKARSKRDAEDVYGRKNAIRRIRRGLYLSNRLWLVNADLNGALQIIKKKFERAFYGLSYNQLLKLTIPPKVVKVIL